MDVLNVKVGDKVLFTSISLNNKTEKVTKVIRITPTGRIRVEIAPEIMFNQRGSEMGRQRGIYKERYISALTPEKETEIKEKSVIQTCKRVFDLRKDKLTYEQAVNILEALDVSVVE